MRSGPPGCTDRHPGGRKGARKVRISPKDVDHRSDLAPPSIPKRPLSTLCSGRYCLQRSLATALLCRMRGSWPTWCSGVRTSPFAAHAWVEADGRPVGEPEDTASYQPMITVPARQRACPRRRRGTSIAVRRWRRQGWILRR
ncbi:lasso peptide biosynthesis B2 protein [Streptomyces sp. IMTB 2501]|uniref:lasso peptide biosynthesis B2 protein n=1 Tax=Streptomyces sp. IMTB 2501 TaxID=1776340 RepID=UPI0009A20E86